MIDQAILDAAAYVGTIDNASGQVCQVKDGKPFLILFELGCATCSEVASKNADEMADQLEVLVNAVPTLIARIGVLEAALSGLVGAENADELRQMEIMTRLLPAPAADKAAMLNAIHALLA